MPLGQSVPVIRSPTEPPSKESITIADLYPDYSAAEQAEADFVLTRFLETVKEIYENLPQN